MWWDSTRKPNSGKNWCRLNSLVWFTHLSVCMSPPALLSMAALAYTPFTPHFKPPCRRCFSPYARAFLQLSQRQAKAATREGPLSDQRNTAIWEICLQASFPLSRNHNSSRARRGYGSMPNGVLLKAHGFQSQMVPQGKKNPARSYHECDPGSLFGKLGTVTTSLMLP